MEITDIITELEKFSIEIIDLFPSININIIDDFEAKNKVVLPNDYKSFLQHYNGLSLMGTSILGINNSDDSYSLESCYNFEHENVDRPMPVYLVPFSPDGGGNHYCFDTRFNNETSCPIIFWQHDYLYSEEDAPEKVNDSFLDWVKEVVIDWTLEDYNYDGTDR